MGEAERFLTDWIDNKLANVHTMMLAKVIEISGSRVSVQPIAKKRAVDGKLRDVPHLFSLPIMSHRLNDGITTKIYTPVYNIDDLVVVVFSERAIDRVIEAPGATDPGSYRKHNINDGVIIGLIQQGV